MDGSKILDARNKFHISSRKEERQQFLMKKRIQLILPDSLEILIPKYIQNQNVEDLEFIYREIKLQSSLLHELKKQYFQQQYNLAVDQKLKIVILKLMYILTQWTKDDYQTAFSMCDHSQILDTIIAYSELKGFEKSSDKSEKLIQIIKNNQQPCQLAQYCYLAVCLTPPPFDSNQIYLIFQKIDDILQKDEYIENCCVILERFLELGCNMDLYQRIIKMKNFKKIVDSCESLDFDIHSSAFEVCIDVLASKQEICEIMVNDFGFLKIIERFLKHPILSIKALWAVSNLLSVQSLIPCLVDVVKFIITSPTINQSSLTQIQFIVVNFLYTCDSEIMGDIHEILPCMTEYLVSILSTPLNPKSQIHQNCIYAIGKSLETYPKIIKIYQRYNLQKQIERFSKDNSNFFTNEVDSILNVFSQNQDQEDS